jgi:serine/threonine-protein kinase RsbW
MSKPIQIDLSLPAIADFVAVARLTVSGVATRMNFTIDDIEDIKIAVSEACTNSIKHAYENSGEGKLDLKYVIDGTSLEITITDYGKGFDPDNIAKNRDVNDLGLGLGITFVKSLMDKTEIVSKIGSGTTIKMTKAVPARG